MFFLEVLAGNLGNGSWNLFGSLHPSMRSFRVGCVAKESKLAFSSNKDFVFESRVSHFTS